MAGTIQDKLTHTKKADQARVRPGEAFWIGFGIVTAILGLLAGTRVLTQLLSTDEYGRLALAVSLATLATQIFGESIGKTGIRFYAGWCAAGNPSGFVKSLVKSLAGAAGCIVFFCIVIMVSGGYADGLPGGWLIMLTGIFAIFVVGIRVASGLEDAARQRQFRGIMQGCFEVLRFLCAAGCVILLAVPDAETVLIGFVIGAFLVAAVHWIFLQKLIRPDRASETDSEKIFPVMDTASMRSFQLPLIACNGFIWLVMMAERWVLKYHGGPGDVGGYAAVYQLAFVPMLFVSNFLVLLLEPVLYQVARLNSKTDASLQALRVNNYAAMGILVFTMLLVILLFFWHPAVGRLFLGSDFRAYSWLFPWLLLAGGCFAAAQQLLLKLSCDMRTGLMAVLWGGMAAAALTAYITGAYFWQLKGIVAGMVAVNASFVMFLVFFLNKKSSAVCDQPPA